MPWCSSYQKGSLHITLNYGHQLVVLFKDWEVLWEDKRVHTFPKGICQKVKVIVWLDFELVYYDSAVQHYNHYTAGTLPGE